MTDVFATANTHRSTGFSVHRDAEENKLIKFTIVVKLTLDEEDEAPSSMRCIDSSDTGKLPDAWVEEITIHNNHA